MAALGTDAGRRVIVETGLALANDALRGRVTIAGFDGSLFGGLEVRGIRITDPAGEPLAQVDALRVRYRLRDLLSGRIVLGQLEIAGAGVTLVEGPDGRFNVERIFRLGEGDDDGGRSPLIAFNDVLLERVRVVVRSGAGGTDGQDERRITIPRARIPFLRLSSPVASGILVRLDQLRLTLSDPALDVRGARGDVRVRGDSVHLALHDVRLPDTRGTLRGALVPTDAGLAFDLRAELSRVRSDDLLGLISLLPGGFAGRARVDVRTPGADVLEFRAEDLAVRTPDAGRLGGTLAMRLGPGERWEVHDADLETEAFPVRYLEAVVDSVPFRGRLTGRTRARGPRERVQATIDWRFRDALVPGDPQTELTGTGIVGIGVPGDLVFQGFAVDRARVALATIGRLVPVIRLEGVLDAVGTLDGPWQYAQFSGALRHVPTAGPPSVARGVLRIDARGDTVGIWTDLRLDSLQLTTWRSAYPGLPLAGAVAGEVRLAGYLDALEARAELAGPNGRLAGTGTIVSLPGRVGARNLDLTFDDLALAPLRERLAGSRFSGETRGALVVDSAAAPLIDLIVRLRPSRIGGVSLDSALARLRATDRVLVADTVLVWAHHAFVAGAGGVGLEERGRDSFALEVAVDPVGALLPLFERLAGAAPGELADTVAGVVRGRVILRGALDTLALTARLEGRELRWDHLTVPRAVLAFAWTGDAGRAEAALVVDTVHLGRLAFTTLEAQLDGRPDALAWHARGWIGRDAAVLGGGTYTADSSVRRLDVDSLGILLGTQAWFLERRARVAVHDTAVAVHDAVIAPRAGGARLSVLGVIPFRGPGDLQVSVERFPIQGLWTLMQYDPREAEGEVSGTLVLTGTARAPVIRSSLAVSDAVFGEFRAPRVEVTLNYRDRRVSGTGGVWRLGQRILELELDLPMDLALRGARERRLPGNISVRARADGVDLAFLSALYPEIRNTAGRLSADFGIAGTWEVPELTGELTVTDGAATFPGLGVRHERLNGRLVLSRDTIYVRALTVATGSGTAAVDGFVRLEGLTAPHLGLRLSASDFRALDVPNFLSATVAGEARLTGPVFAATLTGRAAVSRGVLWFADIVEKDIISLEDTLLTDPEARELLRREGLGREFQNRFFDGLRVDSLVLEMGGDVWLRSTEANIALTGQVLVNKSGRRYRVDGVLETPRGTYRLPLAGPIEREFTVTRGEVRYFGTPDLNAALDIAARHQLRSVRGEPVTIFVHIGGTMETPTLELSSDIRPPISDTEIISYLLVGAPSVQAGSGALAGRAAQQVVEQVAARVTGRVASALIADLSVPIIDYLEVRPELGRGGGAEIAAGKQLGQRFFLALSPRICPQQQATLVDLGGSLEFRMSRQLKFSFSADPVGSCRQLSGIGSDQRYQLGLDVLWDRNY